MVKGRNRVKYFTTHFRRSAGRVSFANGSRNRRRIETKKYSTISCGQIHPNEYGFVNANACASARVRAPNISNFIIDKEILRERKSKVLTLLAIPRRFISTFDFTEYKSFSSRSEFIFVHKYIKICYMISYEFK